MVLAVALATGGLARANPRLDRAREALDDLRYEDALAGLDEALRAGDNDAGETADTYRLLGEVNAALGRTDDAVAAFETWLLLSPDASLPDGVSPKIGEPFATARERAGARDPLGFRCELVPGPPAVVEIEIEADPLDLAAQAFATRRDETSRARLREGATRVSVAGGRPDAVGLLDSHGNRLVTRSLDACEIRAPEPTKDPAPPAREDDGGGASFIGHWALWSGVAVACAGGASFFGLRAMSDVDELDAIYADSSSYEFARADEIEDRARRNALFANIGFAAAGASAVAALILWLRSPTGDDGGNARGARVTPGPRGLGVAIELPF